MTYSLSNIQEMQFDSQSLERENSRKDTTSSEIYETVRSEVRRAIAVIQDNIQDARGPFLLLVESEAASLPLVGVGLSTSQPPPYTVEDSIGTHNSSKTVLGVTLLYFRIKTTAIRRNTSAALVSTEVTDASKLVKPGAVGLVLGIRREYAKELEEVIFLYIYSSYL
ncbi:hypothetical protein Tco_1003382 [Tanacetum coccineum]|uniref:Uncharacterized protein n=1 Tax=Tanacetum coccineum TaxID=301880 RepID=A0ABQ5F9I3_9ASTR